MPESDLEKELREAKESQQAEDDAKREEQQRQIRESRPDPLDSFQRHQQKRTEEVIAEMEEKGSRNIRMSPEYSPPNTVRGTEGDNANFNPERAAKSAAEQEDWDPHGGEDEESGAEDAEPKAIPE